MFGDRCRLMKDSSDIFLLSLEKVSHMWVGADRQAIDRRQLQLRWWVQRCSVLAFDSFWRLDACRMLVWGHHLLHPRDRHDLWVADQRSDFHTVMEIFRQLGKLDSIRNSTGRGERRDSKTTDHVTGCPSRKLKLFGSYCPFSPCAPFSQTSVFHTSIFRAKSSLRGRGGILRPTASADRPGLSEARGFAESTTLWWSGCAWSRFSYQKT